MRPKTLKMAFSNLMTKDDYKWPELVKIGQQVKAMREIDNEPLPSDDPWS